MMAVVAMVLALAPAASAVKFYDSTVGTTSALSSGMPPTPSGTAFGGFFSGSNGGLGDIAINDPSITTDGTDQSGWVYVVDRGHNRVQAFDRDGSFEWATGRDVIAASVNDTQTLTVDASAGQFKLEFDGQTTGDLDWNISAANLDNALDALVPNPGPTVVDTNVVVTGTPANATTTPTGRYAIAFAGTFGAADQPEITVEPGTTPLTGTASVATIADGVASTPGDQGVVFEKCTVAAHCKAGATGSLGGEFNIAQGIDIDQETGDFYVRERNANARVQQFAADGTWIRAFGWDVVASGDGNTGGFETCNAAVVSVTPVCKAGATVSGGPAGQFGSSTDNLSTGLAVAPPAAPNAGTVYAADPANRRVLPFTVPAGPTDAVTAEAPFGTTEFSPGSPRDLAADSNGVIYGSDYSGNASNGNGQVVRFNTVANAFEATISPESDDDFFGRGVVAGMEIDPSTGHLLVGRPQGSASPITTTGIYEYDVSDNPEAVDLAHLVDVHAVGLGAVVTGGAPNNSPRAIGIGDGRFVLSTNVAIPGSGIGERLLVLDDDGVDPDPIVTIQPPLDVTATTATFKGSIDPVLAVGFATSYRWQISKDGITWLDVTDDALVPPDGFTFAEVDHQATGLEPNTLYRLRIRTSRSPAAGLAFSSVLLFHTNPAQPTVETRPAQRVTDSSAELVGNLNPGGLATTYWFEWGDTELANRLPVPSASASGGLDRLVGATLTGLTPERFYHYRLCAQNQLSPSKLCGATRSLLTRPAPASPAADRAYEMVTPPDKPLRQGGLTNGPSPTHDHDTIAAGMPAADGGAFMHVLFAGVIDAESGAGSNWTTNYDVRRRQPGGVWGGNAVLNVAPPAAGANAAVTPGGVSADLATSVWNTMTVPIFRLNGNPSNVASSTGVRQLDDQGGPLGAGWYPWLDLAWFPGPDLNQNGLAVAIGEHRLVEQSPIGRAFKPADGGPAAGTPLAPGDPVLAPAQTTGNAIFLRDAAHDWQPVDLVNECTTAGAVTILPSRDDNGTLAGPSGSFSTPAASYTVGDTRIFITTLAGGTFTGIQVGHFVTGPDIPAGARVTAVNPSPPAPDFPHIVISEPVTATHDFFNGGTVTVSGGQNASNLADDTISVRSCGDGAPTDVRGAVVGAETSGRLGGSSTAAISEDGRRVFFLSPDPAVATGRDACEVADDASGAGTRCPAQLFVRQYDDDGNSTVRWLSRPEDALFEDGDGQPQMHPNGLGTGVSFEGASTDGRYVYFRTDAPLLASDPNGGIDPLVTSSWKSWDLYRYDLGADNNADPAPPAADPAGRLMRISGGPSGAADPNTNCAAVPFLGPDAGAKCVNGVVTNPGSANFGLSDGNPNGGGSALRFVSDDGDRAYFVTAAQIPGADNQPPADSNAANLPTGAGDQINGETRNLYLYDGGSYRFVARVPYAASGTLEACLSSSGRSATNGGSPHLAPDTGELMVDAASAVSCVHGSRSGDAIVFESTAQLTTDDADSAADIYLYDAVADRIERLSAPPPGSSPYGCVTTRQGDVVVACNADFGTTKYLTQHRFGLSGYRHWHVGQDSAGRLTSAFFQSRVPLTEDDVNTPDADGNGGMDVYEWHRDGARLTLVSPGNGEDSSFYTGNSADGRDVYFWTQQRISPWEIDDADGDVYNATTRTDLLAAPSAPPPVCSVLSGGCQGGGGFDAVSTDTKTSSSSESGNAKAEARKTVAVSGLSAKARRKASRTGRLPLKVRASRAGVVRLTARAKLGKKARRVGRVAKRVRAGKAARVNLRLNAAARMRLRSGKGLRVTIEVRQPGVRIRTRSILLPGVKS